MTTRQMTQEAYDAYADAAQKDAAKGECDFCHLLGPTKLLFMPGSDARHADVGDCCFSAATRDGWESSTVGPK